MDDKRFTPPSADVKDKPLPPGAAWKAVLIGFVIDIGGSFLASTLIGIAYVVSLASQGLSQKEIQAALSSTSQGSWYFAVATLAGAGFSFLGGYWCARVARRSEYRLGAILAMLSTGFGLLLSDDGTPASQLALLSLTTIACVLLGAKFGKASTSAA